MSQSQSRKARREAYRERVRKVKKYHKKMRNDPTLLHEMVKNLEAIAVQEDENNESNIS